MSQTIHIPADNARFGRRVPVGANGAVTFVPVDVDYVASDGEVTALSSAGIPLADAIIPDGMIVISSAAYGRRVPIGINGIVRYLSTGVPFTPTPAEVDAIIAGGISFTPVSGGVLNASGGYVQNALGGYVIRSFTNG
jgi:hypothetical protein